MPSLYLSFGLPLSLFPYTLPLKYLQLISLRLRAWPTKNIFRLLRVVSSLSLKPIFSRTHSFHFVSVQLILNNLCVVWRGSDVCCEDSCYFMVDMFYSSAAVFFIYPGLSPSLLQQNRVPKCDVTIGLFLEYCNFGLKF